MGTLVPTCDMTVKVNSTSAPSATLALKAGVGVTWAKNFAGTQPFGSDAVGELQEHDRRGSQSDLRVSPHDQADLQQCEVGRAGNKVK